MRVVDRPTVNSPAVDRTNFHPMWKGILVEVTLLPKRGHGRRFPGRTVNSAISFENQRAVANATAFLEQHAMIRTMRWTEGGCSPR